VLSTSTRKHAATGRWVWTSAKEKKRKGQVRAALPEGSEGGEEESAETGGRGGDG